MDRAAGRRWSRHGLFARSEALAAAILGPLALCGALGLWSIGRLEESRREDHALLARVLAARIDEALRYDVAMSFRGSGRIVEPDRAAAVAFLRKEAGELTQHATIQLRDRSGGVLATASRGDPDPLERDVASADLALAPWTVALREPPESPRHAHAFRVGLLLLVPASAVTAAIFAWGSARSIMKPLAALTESAERIAGGDLTQPVPELPEDEVGTLGRSLEAMRGALARSVDELERRVAERTRKLEELSKELERRDERRTELLAKLISAQEEERKRVARELHDETCQTLAALLMRLDGSPAAAPADLSALASRALDGVHRLIGDLRPSMLDDLGLVPALRADAERRLAPRGIAVRFESELPPERLPREKETLLYRIVQEALTNVARHSGADAVLVQLAANDGHIVVEIEDDGDGFDPMSVSKPSATGRGLGVLGMRERAALLGGTLKIDSAPGEGTRVVVTVPR